MKARFKQFVAMVTVLVLVLSFLPPALADSGNGMTNATLLTPGKRSNSRPARTRSTRIGSRWNERRPR